MKESKIISLATALNDGTMWSVQDLLQSTLIEMEHNVLTPKKGVVILLDDSMDQYDVKFRQAGMRMSQLLALNEVFKTIVLDEMGYGRGN